MGISNSCRLALDRRVAARLLLPSRRHARARPTSSAATTLLISTTTYQDVGAVAGLVTGVRSSPAQRRRDIDGGVKRHPQHGLEQRSADPSFGVTSAIGLSDLNAKTGAVLASTTLDPSIVSTSFSSKSELGLNLTKTSTGYVATFMGYAGGGVGNLDVSNSDTTAYKDTTNPVTSFFAPGANQTYAFNRSVVAFNANGSYTATQTLAYGGNNGRSAVLAPNGLYYTVGNSNNGSGTPTQLTTSTGLNVVTPGSTPNSTMIDPTFKSLPGDKAGKNNNFRGLTYYDGNLYFTKGSGSNGIDTVYTVSNPNGQLPTSATASNASISILPGTPDRPRQDGPGLHSVRPLLRQPDDALCRRRGNGRRDRSGGPRRPREMVPVGRDLVARLYVAGGPDRRHLQRPRLGFRRNHHRPAQPYRRGQCKRDRHVLGDDLDQQRLGRQRRRSE